MLVDLFDFELPTDRIALRPKEPRESARLLEVDPHGGLADRRVADLPRLFRPGDMLVINDTRVLPAAMLGFRKRAETTARIEAMLHKRISADQWLAFVRPAKKLAVGERICFASDGETLSAECLSHHGEGEVLLAFDRAGAALDASIERHGRVPLPPYIARKRASDAEDKRDYQTIFARESGAVAAPTASLHFTPQLVAALVAMGVRLEYVTLHVGAGTFLPVKAGDTEQHRMHSEWARLEQPVADRLNEARRAGGRIIAAGTTSLRTLETCATPNGDLRSFEGETDLFVTPGFRFRVVDCLLTNFHLPRSTLLMLVSAFVGLPTMHRAYAHAIEEGYRFYSYGDACFLHRAAAS